MNCRHLRNKNLSLFTTLVVACCLLLTGVRVPDLARHHRPKPSQRAILENQVKGSQYVIKKAADVVAVLAPPLECDAVLPSRTDFRAAFHPAVVPVNSPNASRAPPVVPA